MSCYVTHLESAIDGTHLPAGEIHSMHEGRPLWVRYDLDRLRDEWRREDLRDRAPGMWRYRELLPLPADAAPVTLGEGSSPLLDCPRMARRLDLDQLRVKDESQLPTGSFKSRGLGMAISMAHHFGIQRVALPSAGNAGGAAAAYAARAGIEAYVFMPEDTPIINQVECRLAGARTFLANGLIHQCGRIVREGIDVMQWFDLSTLKEPYRLEGKKTMGLELAEQCNWQLPDVIFYPTGGGTGLIGMWKAFQELAALGWIDGRRMPRMVSVQARGCCPIVRAWEAGERFAEPFPDAQTSARGIRVPAAVGDFMILDAVRESGGMAIAVDEDELVEAMFEFAGHEGISICPEAAACAAAVRNMRRNGQLDSDESVVIFNTGAAQKYLESLQGSLPHIDLEAPLDWDLIAA